MNKYFTALSLLMMNIGIFVGTTVFLPRNGSFGFSGPLSYFINARARWDIAWGVLVATLFLSLGVFLWLKARGVFDQEVVDQRSREREVDS